MTVSPEPRRRWVPSRAGIRNIWEYDEQVFEFGGGRMILRGPNGSGKSNALALLFPFVFDGRLGAQYMDPFGGGRSMRGLLLGEVRDDAKGGYRHDQRLGYVWMEFRRPAAHDDEADDYFTVGCGARASASSASKVSSWFFTTARRVGIDIDLAPNNLPLTRSQLSDSLEAGAVRDSAEEHRAAVARDLLSIDAAQLDKLIALIRALRRPQLAGKLDVQELSAVLSAGLPAVSPDSLDDIATSFDDLERIQHELANADTALKTLNTFVPTYRAYLEGEARERAASVRRADEQRAQAIRRRDRAARQAAELGAWIESERARRSEHQTAAETARAEVQALRNSDRFRGALDLEQAEQLARAREEAAETANEAAVRADDEARRAAKLADESRQEAVEASTKAAAALQRLADSADALDAVWSLSMDDAVDPAAIESAVKTMERERRHALEAVRSALNELRVARSLDDKAKRDAAVAAREADEASQRAADAEATCEKLRTEAAAAVTVWAEHAPGLDDEARHELVSLVDVVGTPDAVPFGDRYTALSGPARDDLLDRRTTLDGVSASLENDIAAKEADRAAVAAERDDAPPVPPWRRTPRAGRPGAPLWAVCDFAPGLDLDDAARARIEAALEAAGLLDAWIAPDGALDLASTSSASAARSGGASSGVEPGEGESPGGESSEAHVGESWFDASGGLADGFAGPGADGATSLRRVLVADLAADSQLDLSTVNAVLDSVSLGTAGISVDAAGRFRIGPLVGRATKEHAEYIGATARSERRRRRIAALDDELEGLRSRLGETRSERAAVQGQLDAIETARRAVPDVTALAQSVERASSLRRTATDKESTARDRALDEQHAATQLANAAEGLVRVGERERVPTSSDGVEEFQSRLAAFSGLGQQAVIGRRDEYRISSAAELASAEAAGRSLAAREAAARAEASDREARAQRGTVEALRRTVGADAARVMEEIAALEARERANESEVQTIGAQIEAKASELGGLEADRVSASKAIEVAEQQLDHAASRLRVLRRSDVTAFLFASSSSDSSPSAASPSAAVPEVESGEAIAAPAPLDSAGGVVELPVDPTQFARVLGERVGTRPDPAAHLKTKQAIDAAHKRLIDELHQGYHPALVHDDDLIVIEIASDDRATFGLAVLCERLAAQVEQMSNQLTEGDRDIFERHLLNAVAHELRRLLGDADEFVQSVNDALSRTATASGYRVQLEWTAKDSSPEVRNALALLRRDTEQMGEDERLALRNFFDASIRRQRAEDPDSGYRANLETVVDYRSWHRFQPFLIAPDGGRSLLTRERFRTLSGGEQAVALHLPLFAAAAAHYNRAAADAPRLVALDEAFAGIDEAMRGELLGLTVAFDLDVLLTGHELWGAYAEVPEITIHDLLRRPPAEGVSVMSFRWNGLGLDPVEAKPALRPRRVAENTDPLGGLFGDDD